MNRPVRQFEGEMIVKLKFKHCHYGVWMSKNGHKAFENGERPLFMWPKGVVKDLIPTVKHHIARECGKKFGVPNFTFESVMFYAEV